MNSGKTVFGQLLQFISRNAFDPSVGLYRGEHGVKIFTTFDPLLSLGCSRISWLARISRNSPDSGEKP
jgi:hypothetical protein